jgi:drug/metabolite transporter (DMT)-like permease
MEKFGLLGKSSLFASAFLWGIGFVAVEGALLAGWNPMLLLAVRGFMGGALLLAFSYKRKFWNNKPLLKDSLIAGVYLSAAFVAQTYGQSLSGPANAAFITALYVIFTPFIYALKERKMVSGIVLVAAFASFVGVALISVRGSLSWQWGDFLLVVCAVLFAIHILQLEKMGHHDDALSITTIQLFVMGVLCVLFVPFLNVSVPSIGWGYVAYCGLVSSGIAFFLQTFGQKHVPSSAASIILTFEAIFGALGAVLFYRELFSLQMFFGGLLLVGSVFFLELVPKSTKIPTVS